MKTSTPHELALYLENLAMQDAAQKAIDTQQASLVAVFIVIAVALIVGGFVLKRHVREIDIRTEVNEHKRDLTLDAKKDILVNRVELHEHKGKLSLDAEKSKMSLENKTEKALLALEDEKARLRMAKTYEKALLMIQLKADSLSDEELSALKDVILGIGNNTPADVLSDSKLRNEAREEVLNTDEEIKSMLVEADLNNIQYAKPTDKHPRMSVGNFDVISTEGA